jgi:hypothetical protein
MKHVTRILAAAASAAALSLPLATSAAPTARTLVLESRVMQQMHAGEFDGRMRLVVTSDGIINGTYQDEDTGLLSNVIGGVDPAGNNLWLEVGGPFARDHFVGTLKGTTIDADAYHGADPYHLIAKPAN